MTITIAAISDIHLEKNSIQKYFFHNINNQVNLLIIGGDIANGEDKYTKKFLELISNVKIPILIVLGNHDQPSCNDYKIKKLLLTNPIIKILNGDYVEYEFNKLKIGIVGASGYGGGFLSDTNNDRGIEQLSIAQQKIGKPIPDFILDQMQWEKEDQEVKKLKNALSQMKKAKPDIMITVTHWAAFKEVVEGERLEFYPLFGSSKLGDEIIRVKPDLVLNGHSHHGPQGIKKINKISICNISYEVNKKKLPLFDLSIEKDISLRYL